MTRLPITTTSSSTTTPPTPTTHLEVEEGELRASVGQTRSRRGAHALAVECTTLKEGGGVGNHVGRLVEQRGRAPAGAQEEEEGEASLCHVC